MPSAEIVVSFCNPRKEGKKNASVKTDDGQFYLVPPDLYSQFTQGGKYKVDYEAFKSNTGDTLRTIKKVEQAGPAPIAKHQAGKYGVTDMETAERIFVCGQMNALSGNPNIDPRGLTLEEFVMQVNKLRETWRRTFGHPQQDAEMSDEIPF